MQLVKSPWRELFYDLSASCKKSIKITSPYVKDNVVSHLMVSKKDAVKVSLLTSFKLMNYYSGASDLNALEHVLKNSGSVGNVQKLHSKIYIFDDEKAVITSGNLTNGGLSNNYEYGVYFDESDIVAKIQHDFVLLSEDENTGKISMSEINQAKNILSNVPKSKPITLPDIEIYTGSDDVEIFTGGVDSITSSLTGWKLEVFNCLLNIKGTEFTIADINLFVPVLSRRFPGNNNIEAKIRQQLQYLRDIGLVEFLSKGKYKKLWV